MRVHSSKRGISLIESGIFLLAFTLFLHHLDAQSLWYDEAVSARLATMSVADLVRWTAADIQPPLYYLLLHGWQGLFGNGEWALRALSAWWAFLAVAIGYALAYRITHTRAAARLTALALATAPWMVYYAQEARMYTMLVALSLTLGYLVLALNENRGNVRRGFLLGGVILLLLYTHYFSLFLVLTFAFWHLIALLSAAPPRRRPFLRHWALPWGIAGGVTLIGYAVWMPYLLQRLRVDASYWKGTLKLGEALRHWFVHMTLGAPETFLEKQAVAWLPLFGVITLTATLVHLANGRSQRQIADEKAKAMSFPSDARLSAFLYAWLFLPALLILALAYRTPKFNPRYLMMVYPAWILLLTTAGYKTREAVHKSEVTHYLSLTTRYSLLIILSLFLWADVQWFTNPAFTKPDFRGALRYIQEHRAPTEPLILVSGHMSPVVDYYAPNIPYLRLPDIDVLDVNQVLGFEVAKPMNRFLRGKRGVWLLLWQDNVVDPMGVVPFLLEQSGTEDTHVPNAFWHVRVRHYVLPPQVHIPEQPPITHPLQVDWGHRVEFLGITEGKENDAYFFFRALTPLEADYRIHVEMWDEAGHLWGQGDARPGPYGYPTFRWSPNRIIMGHHNLPAWPGTPAGDYTLRVRLYTEAHPDGLDILDAAGNPQGRDAIVSGVPLRITRPYTDTKSVAWPPLAPRLRGKPVWQETRRPPFMVPFDALAYRVIPAGPYEPGQRVELQIAWRATRAPSPNDVVTLTMIYPGSPHTFLGKFILARYPTSRWPDTGVFFTQWQVRVPKNTPPVIVNVTFTYVDKTTGRVQRLPFGMNWDIHSSSRTFQVPQVTYPVEAVFGDVIRLVGVDMDPTTWQGGLTVPITLTWQALTEVDRSYTAFVHVLGPDGRVIAQEDHIPGRGTHPTDEWLADEVIQDRYDLHLPTPLPRPLVLEIGLYDALAPGMPRLPVTQGPDTGATAVHLPIK